MDDAAITRKLLRLANNRNATVDQLMAGIALMDEMVARDNAYRAANPQPPKPVLSDAERAANARRAANANLVKLRRGR